jgi:hypothetical protein
MSARTTAPSGRRSTFPVFTVAVMMASSSGDQNANAPPWWPKYSGAGRADVAAERAELGDENVLHVARLGDG